MSFKRNIEIETQTHKSYTDFKLKQWIVEIPVGKKLVMSILDEDDKLIETEVYVGQFINCHANITIQDKGAKK